MKARLKAADACIECAREFKPDAVLGLGGGSNMDLAKITATVLSHGGEPKDYVGDDRVPGPVLPLICLPTTAGTGRWCTYVGATSAQTPRRRVE